MANIPQSFGPLPVEKFQAGETGYCRLIGGPLSVRERTEWTDLATSRFKTVAEVARLLISAEFLRIQLPTRGFETAATDVSGTLAYNQGGLQYGLGEQTHELNRQPATSR
jgi:hypothetical protein